MMPGRALGRRRDCFRNCPYFVTSGGKTSHHARKRTVRFGLCGWARWLLTSLVSRFSALTAVRRVNPFPDLIPYTGLGSGLDGYRHAL